MIFLPWPPAELSPNAREHFRTIAKVKKKYRRDCYYATLAAAKPLLPEDQIPLGVIFSPPFNRKRDLDNCIASAKALFDGLADAWRVDDSRFHIVPKMGERVPLGNVAVQVLQTKGEIA